MLQLQIAIVWPWVTSRPIDRATRGELSPQSLMRASTVWIHTAKGISFNFLNPQLWSYPHSSLLWPFLSSSLKYAPLASVINWYSFPHHTGPTSPFLLPPPLPSSSPANNVHYHSSHASSKTIWHTWDKFIVALSHTEAKRSVYMVPHKENTGYHNAISH